MLNQVREREAALFVSGRILLSSTTDCIPRGLTSSYAHYFHQERTRLPDHTHPVWSHKGWCLTVTLSSQPMPPTSLFGKSGHAGAVVQTSMPKTYLPSRLLTWRLVNTRSLDRLLICASRELGRELIGRGHSIVTATPGSQTFAIRQVSNMLLIPHCRRQRPASSADDRRRPFDRKVPSLPAPRPDVNELPTLEAETRERSTRCSLPGRVASYPLYSAYARWPPFAGVVLRSRHSALSRPDASVYCRCSRPGSKATPAGGL